MTHTTSRDGMDSTTITTHRAPAVESLEGRRLLSANMLQQATATVDCGPVVSSATSTTSVGTPTASPVKSASFGTFDRDGDGFRTQRVERSDARQAIRVNGQRQLADDDADDSAGSIARSFQTKEVTLPNGVTADVTRETVVVNPPGAFTPPVAYVIDYITLPGGNAAPGGRGSADYGDRRSGNGGNGGITRSTVPTPPPPVEIPAKPNDPTPAAPQPAPGVQPPATADTNSSNGGTITTSGTGSKSVRGTQAVAPVLTRVHGAVEPVASATNGHDTYIVNDVTVTTAAPGTPSGAGGSAASASAAVVASKLFGTGVPGGAVNVSNASLARLAAAGVAQVAKEMVAAAEANVATEAARVADAFFGEPAMSGRTFNFQQLGDPMTLLGDALAAFADESVSLGGTLAHAQAAQHSQTERAWAVTGAVVAIDAAVLTYWRYSGKRRKSAKWSSQRITV